jgi:L-iditol 2-dehydrogenase
MKAMMLTGIRRMEMREVPDPAIRGDRDVLLRMAVIGVCGSDIHYYVDGRIGSQVVEYPFTVGHEGAAVVESVGRGVKRVKPGDRVAIEPAMPCGDCDQCRAGRPHTCRKLRFLGCPKQAEGCLSEKIVMPEGSCFPIRDGMSFEQAALSEPLAIGVYGVRQSIPMKGARIGILGAGPIGLSVLLPAKAQGAGRIYVTDRIDARVEFARKMGATWAGNPDREDIVEAVRSREPGLLDAVFECCGQQAAIDQAFEILKPGGKIMVIGIPKEKRLSFPVDTMRHREACIQNVRRQNHCIQPTLDMIDRKEADVDPLVTHRFPFEKTREAFDLVADYRDGVIKAMVHFEGAAR